MCTTLIHYIMSEKHESCNIERNMLKCVNLVAIILLAYAVAALYLTLNAVNVVTPENLVFSKQQTNLTDNGGGSGGGCNLFSGRWVYDDVSYPLYKEGQCALIGEEFSCEKYGRKNLKYHNWRWQPHHCDLPKFNGTALLEKLRNKKLLFVGDSLNRNQWRSMLCLIDPYLPPSTNKTVVFETNSLNLKVKDYNATIAFYWAPFLVESTTDDILKHKSRYRTIGIKTIEKHGRHWIHADILIFDSFAWWKPDTMTMLWGSFGSSDAVYQKVNATLHKLRPYEMALSTWSDWLEFNIDRNKTKIFFMSTSPFVRGKTNWGTSGGCYNLTKPRFDERNWQYAPTSVMKAVESTIEKLGKRGVKVEYLKITHLSSYREDAHPSIYMVNYKYVVPELRDPNKISDCLHWCLPGVPDVWNQILYAHIMKP